MNIEKFIPKQLNPTVSIGNLMPFRKSKGFKRLRDVVVCESV